MIGLNLRIVELGLVIGFIEKNREKKRERNGPKKAPMQIHGSHFQESFFCSNSLYATEREGREPYLVCHDGVRWQWSWPPCQRTLRTGGLYNTMIVCELLTSEITNVFFFFSFFLCVVSFTSFAMVLEWLKMHVIFDKDGWKNMHPEKRSCHEIILWKLQLFEFPPHTKEIWITFNSTTINILQNCDINTYRE